MENLSDKKAQIKFKAKLNIFDAFLTSADDYFKESFFEDAQESTANAIQQLDELDQQHPQVKFRTAIAKDMKGSIAKANGQLENAEIEFKEAIAILSSITDESVPNVKAFIEVANNKLSQLTALKVNHGQELDIDVMETVGAATSKIMQQNTESAEINPPPAKKRKLSDPSTSLKIPDKKLPGVKTTKEKKFVCPWEGCDKSYVHKHHLDRHIKSAHEKIRVVCVRGCGKDFADEDAMRVHVRTVHDKVKLPCPHCDKQFVSKVDLDSHVQKIHEGGSKERHQCEHCGKNFARFRNLRNHIVVSHAGVRRYKCESCGNLFNSSSELKEHLRCVHDKVEKFNCAICETKFIYRSTFVKHTKDRSCFICKADFKCSLDYFAHRYSHEYTCEVCNKMDCKYGIAHAHSLNSHWKVYDCPLGVCDAKFMSKGSITTHLVNVHKMQKCLACPQCFENENEMLQHCKRDHPQYECALCSGNIIFKYFIHKQLSSHIISMHKNIFHCCTCGNFFSSSEIMRDHQCSGQFSTAELKLLNFLRQPIDLRALENISCIFTDENGLVQHEIPIFPPQCNMFFNTALNNNVDQRSYQIHVNQDQRLFQCGTTAILCWCLEVNSLAWCIERIEWERNNEGALLPKPRFDRSQIRFKKDANDKIFDIRSSTLHPPYHMGHARAAGNCWTEVDFRASFSNLNYWPMHERLNSVHWRILEEHIRREAKLFLKATVITGAIFMKNAKVEANYVKGVYCPPAFFKLAAFEEFDNKFVIKCWLMYNNASNQSVEGSEISLLLLERATRTKFFTKQILDKIDNACVMKHRKELRRHDDYLGIR